MAKEKELSFQKKVIKLARSLGWRCAHFPFVRVLTPDGRIRWMTPVQGDAKGFPDLLLIRGERLVIAELKREGGELEPEQVEWLAAFSLMGAETKVWLPWMMSEIEEYLR